jgi:hypothetical protein
MGILNNWTIKWAKEQKEQSDHPLEFWLWVTICLIENRRKMDADILSPLGSKVNDWKLQGFLISINARGMEMEEEKGIENAFPIYEICVAEQFSGTIAYDRLRIWYTKIGWFKDAIRVCRAYNSTPNANSKAKERYEYFIQRLHQKAYAKQKKIDKLSRRE